MDLVAGVRKEGSRGGRDSFKWSDVKESQHRENYLGHSLMAPVGRWQKGRDLQWYAKGDDDDDADKVRTEREQEIQRVKEAEQEAMARALGLPVAPKSTNANLTPLGGKEVQRAIQETAGDDAEGGKGIGFKSYGGRASGARLGLEADRLEGVGLDEHPIRRDKRDRSRSRDRRRDRSRDRNRDRDRDREWDSERRHHRHHHRHERERHRHERRHRSRSKSLSRDLDYRQRSPSRERSREERRVDAYERHRHSGRSRSPYQDRRTHRRSGRD